MTDETTPPMPPLARDEPITATFILPANPAPALSVEEARWRHIEANSPEEWARLDAYAAAIRAESAEALRAATARAERLERGLQMLIDKEELPPAEFIAKYGQPAWKAPSALTLRAALSATEEGQG